MELKDFKKKLREAVANYMRSEGCSCCQDRDAHREYKKEMWSKLQKEVTEKWEQDKHQLQEFGFDVKVAK